MAKKRGFNVPLPLLRFLIIVGVLGGVGFAVYKSAVHYFTTSPMFTIRDVVLEPQVRFIQSRSLQLLKGKNIFLVDLRRLQREINYQYPQVADLCVLRRFPDRIIVMAKKRDLVAQVAWKSRFLVIDDQSVIVFVNQNADEKLPQILGIRREGLRIMPGMPLRVREVSLALDLIKAVRQNPALNRMPLMMVDVGNVSKIAIGFGNNFTVYLDDDNIRSKLNVLTLLLTQHKLDFNTVAYVDLRFKEPVVGTKQER